MKLYELLNHVEFNEVFADILRYVPEVENQKAWFLPAFDALLSITPAMESDVVIEVQRQDMQLY